MGEQVRDIKHQSWIEGAYEQMDKRIKLMEDLYQSIERKLWILIALTIGSLSVNLAFKCFELFDLSIYGPGMLLIDR